MKRFVVLGAGGIGTAVASMLSAGGTDVTLVTHFPEASAHLVQYGTRVVGSVEIAARPGATSDPVSLGSTDVLVLAVKAHQTLTALQRVRGTPAAALSLQNGIEKEAALLHQFGPERVVCSVVQVTASLLSAGVSRCAAIEPSAVSPAHPLAARLAAEVAETLSACGMPTAVVDDAAAIEWTKAAQWLPSALLTAATSLSLDQVLRDEDLARTYVAIVRECVAVAKAKGVQLVPFGRLYAARVAQGTTDAGVAELIGIGASMSEGHLAGYRTSMELDLAMGRPPELDPTAGAMQRAAAAVGVHCPVLQAIVAVVKGRTRAAVSELEVAR